MLIARLPPMSRLDADAEHEAHLAQEREEIKARMQEALMEEMDKPAMPRRTSSSSSDGSRSSAGFFKRRASSSARTSNSGPSGSAASSAAAQRQTKRNWESHDVYRAIESVAACFSSHRVAQALTSFHSTVCFPFNPCDRKKDLTTLFEIRDSAFNLLVQKTGSQTPLLYASRE